MDLYTKAMLEIVGMPRSVKIRGKNVSPEILFSSSLCESMLFWQAASMSVRLHDEVLLKTVVVADKKSVSGAKLVSLDRDRDIEREGLGIGLASSLMILSGAGDIIISPSRKHEGFDYSDSIYAFREAINKGYADGQVLDPSDHVLNSVFYDTIVKPSRAIVYKPEDTILSRIKP